MFGADGPPTPADGSSRGCMSVGRATILLGALLLAIGVVALLVDRGADRTDREAVVPRRPELPATAAEHESEDHQGFLYAHVTANDGSTFEGRVRFGGDEEAFWGDAFNGRKEENPWAAYAPAESLKESRPVEIFGVHFSRTREIDLTRPFVARFGDLKRIEVDANDLLVTLKSGSSVLLDRLSYDDIADGLRVWDRNGVVDLDENQIRTIEFRATPQLDSAPARLWGTVRTQQGDVSGFVLWDRRSSLVSDELWGRSDEGRLTLSFDEIVSIERGDRERAIVTLRDGSVIELEVHDRYRGLAVDDKSLGRVLVSWEAVERVDFHRAGSGRAYDDFNVGRPLHGRVTSRAGYSLSGRIVYDLDESETTDTFDGSLGDVSYAIPFGSIASIQLAGVDVDAERALVTLRNDEVLELERRGDLGLRVAGTLVFTHDSASPEYIHWSDVERIDFAPPPPAPVD